MLTRYTADPNPLPKVSMRESIVYSDSSRVSFTSQNSLAQIHLLNRICLFLNVGFRVGKNSGHKSQRRIVPKETAKGHSGSYRRQSLYRKSLHCSYEDCEKLIIAAIKNRSGEVDIDLRSEINAIFRKLREDLKNRPLELQKNTEIANKINSELEQIKEELKLNSNLLKVELDKIKFQLDSLNTNFNGDLLMYKQITGITKSLEKVMEEYEKLDKRIREVSLKNVVRINTQPTNIQRVRNPLFNKICFESNQLLEILENIKQSAAKKDEEAVVNYRMDLEDQRNLLSSLLTEAEGDRDYVLKASICNYDIDSKKSNSEIVKFSQELDTCRERLKSVERELDSVHFNNPIYISKNKMKLVASINKMTSKFSETSKVFEIEIKRKIEEYSEVLKHIKRDIISYKAIKEEMVNELRAELSKRKETIDELNKLLKKTKNEKENEAAKRILLEKELLKLKLKLNDNISISKAKREIKDLKDSTDKRIRDIILLFMLKIDSKLEQLESATRNAKSIVKFVGKQSGWYKNTVRQLKEDNEVLRQENNSLKQHILELNMELRNKEDEIKKIKKLIQDEIENTERARDEVKKQKLENDELQNEISSLSKTIRDTRYERDALADNSIQLKREKDTLITQNNTIEHQALQLEQQLNDLMSERTQLRDVALEINEKYKYLVNEKETLEDSLTEKLINIKTAYEKLLINSYSYIEANNKFHNDILMKLETEVKSAKNLVNDYEVLKKKLLKLLYCARKQFESLKSNVASKDEIIVKYEELMKKVSNDTDVLVGANEALIRQNKILSEEVDHYKREVENMKDELVVEKKSKKEMEMGMQEEFESKLKRIDEEIVQKLNKNIESLQKTIRELKEKLKAKEDIEQEKEELEKSVRDKNKEVRAQSVVINDLKDDIKSKDEQIRVHTNTVNNLKEVINKQEQDILNQKEAVSKLNKKWNRENSKTLKNEVDTLSKNIQELNETISNKEEEIELQKELIRKLKNKVGEKDEEVKLERDLIEKLNANIKRKSEEIKNNENEIKQLNNTVNTLNLKLKESTRELKLTTENHNEEVIKKDKEIISQSNKIKEVNNNIKVQEEEIMRMKKSAKSKEEELKVHKELVNNLKEEITNNKRTIKNKQTEIDKLNKEIKEKEEEIETQKEAINELKTLIKNKEMQPERLLDEEVKESNKAHKANSINKEPLVEKTHNVVVEVKEECKGIKDQLKNYGTSLKLDLETIRSLLGTLNNTSKIKDSPYNKWKEELLGIKSLIESLKQDKEEVVNAHNNIVPRIEEDLLNMKEVLSECILGEKERQNQIIAEYKEKLFKLHEQTLNKLHILKAKGIEAADELESFKVVIAEMQKSLANTRERLIKEDNGEIKNNTMIEEKNKLEAICHELKENLKISESRIEELERDNKELEEVIVKEREEHVIELNYLKDHLEATKGQYHKTFESINNMTSNTASETKEDLLNFKEEILEDVKMKLNTLKSKVVKESNKQKQAHREFLIYTLDLIRDLKNALNEISTSQQVFTEIIQRIKLALRKLKDNSLSNEDKGEESMRISEPVIAMSIKGNNQYEDHDSLKIIKQRIIEEVQTTSKELSLNVSESCNELNKKLEELNEKLRKVKEDYKIQNHRYIKENDDKEEECKKLEDENKVARECIKQAIQSLEEQNNEEDELVPLTEHIIDIAMKLHEERDRIEEANKKCKEYLQQYLKGKDLFELCKESIDKLNDNEKQLKEKTEQLTNAKELIQYMAIQFDNMNSSFISLVIDKVNNESLRLNDCHNSLKAIEASKHSEEDKELIVEQKLREDFEATKKSLSTICNKLYEILYKHGVILDEEERNSPEVITMYLNDLVRTLSEHHKGADKSFDLKPEELLRGVSHRSNSILEGTLIKEGDLESSVCDLEAFGTPKGGSNRDLSMNAQIKTEYEEIKERIKIIIRTWEGKEGEGTIDEVERIIEAMGAELEAKKSTPRGTDDELKTLTDEVNKLQLILKEKNKDVVLFINP